MLGILVLHRSYRPVTHLFNICNDLSFLCTKCIKLAHKRNITQTVSLHITYENVRQNLDEIIRIHTKFVGRN